MKNQNQQINAILHVYSKQVEKQALIALQTQGFYGINPCENAPQSLEDLKAFWFTKPFNRMFPVWNGASDQTIFDDAKGNYLFRAWHDLGHVLLNAPFNLEGEKQVSAWQESFLPKPYNLILHADVVGQTEYYQEYGDFPKDQRKFIIDNVFNAGLI